MDFLSNLTSLALGGTTVIKPQLTSYSRQPNSGSKYLNEVDREKTNSFGSNNPMKENRTRQEIDYNSAELKQKELNYDEKIIPEQEKRIITSSKIFSGISESISDESNGLTKSINTGEHEIYNNNLLIIEEKEKKSFDNQPVASTDNVLKIINNLFEGEETVLNLKNPYDKTDNSFALYSVNPESTQANRSENKSTKPGFDVGRSDALKTSVVKINIGKIEVKAVYPEKEISSEIEQNKSQLSLNDYLRSFNEGKR